jgi:ribosomal protein L37AE/L43A
LELAKKDREKKERKADRDRKIEIRPRREWVALAQKAFNAYIRKRDEHLPCISCGRAHVEIIVGGNWDCGHYLTVGAHPELRFEELNAAKQCKRCNAGSARFSHKGRTVANEYRDSLIGRIGLENVLWLEGNHEPKKYTIDELKEICRDYKMKLKGTAMITIEEL